MVSNSRGQISVMIGVMMTTFILFFAFVINTGMLVNAKINLQNAADLAAFAGASVQARQLTNISYLNYEMRRRWKKYLYRIYVIGNRGYDSFPGNQGGVSGGQMVYQPNSNSPNLKVPVTCVDFGNATGCRLTKLPKLIIPTASNPLDSISQVLNTSMTALEAIREQNAAKAGQGNQLLNVYWLYNTDPSLALVNSELQAGNLPPTTAASLKTIEEYAKDLGIVPEEIILRMRISTLNGYVNTPAQNISLSAYKQMIKAPNLPANERSLLAFSSAYYTLGTYTYSENDLKLQELLPSTILSLVPISLNFTTYSLDYDSSTGDSETVVMALPYGNPTSGNGGLVLGFYKDPNYLTYYAVQLSATANIMFSPFGPLMLQAYAAARPFGSRIGPETDSSKPLFSFTSSAMASTANIPSVLVKDSDTSLTPSNGWNDASFISALSSKHDDYYGIQIAMAPNPWEATRYNIPNNLGDSFQDNFVGNGTATIWAPISNSNDTTELKSEISSAIQVSPSIATNSGIQSSQTANGNLGDPSTITSFLQKAMLKYVESLSSGNAPPVQGISDGFNVVRFSNPTLDPSNAALTPLGASSYFMNKNTAALQLKTSWNTLQGGYMNEGRTGYSVKFVALRSIDGTTPTNDPQTGPQPGIANGLSSISVQNIGEPPFKTVLGYIKH